MLAALAPEVGADFFDETLFPPSISDGLYHRRLVVGQAKGHKVFFRELLGESIEIADISLRGLRAQSAVVKGVDLVAIDLQLVVETTLGKPKSELDGALRFLTTFKQIGYEASTETVEGCTTTEHIERITQRLENESFEMRC